MKKRKKKRKEKIRVSQQFDLSTIGNQQLNKSEYYKENQSKENNCNRSKWNIFLLFTRICLIWNTDCLQYLLLLSSLPIKYGVPCSFSDLVEGGALLWIKEIYDWFPYYRYEWQLFVKYLTCWLLLNVSFIVMITYKMTKILKINIGIHRKLFDYRNMNCSEKFSVHPKRE